METNQMLEIVLKKLVRSLRSRNARITNDLDKRYEEMQIDTILDMIEEYGVKLAFTVVNQFNGNVFVSNLEHASHRHHGDCIYNAIHLDFAKAFKRNRKNDNVKENDAVTATLLALEFEWSGNVATCNKLTF